jgi:hypothetical protein
MAGRARFDILRNPQLIFEVVALQCGIFLLDAATLLCTSHAVGLNVDVGAIFMSFILASVVATLSPIPLGLGSFEGTCTGLLHLMGGFTLWIPMLPGLWEIRREAMRPAIDTGVAGAR